MLNCLSRSVSTAELIMPMSDLYRCMGYGDTLPDAEICELSQRLFDEACQVARPLFHYSIFDCQVEQLSVLVHSETHDDVTFECGKTISGLLKRSQQMAIFVATAGEEFQQWIDQRAASGEILESFIIDSIGSMIAEATGDYLETVLEKEFAGSELRHTNRFSPGYCGWDILEQRKLFGLLPEGVCSIDLNESCLMHPIKSISGFIGVGESVITKKYGCSICTKTDCYLRKK